MNQHKISHLLKPIFLGVVSATYLSAIELPEKIDTASDIAHQRMLIDKFIGAFKQQKNLENIKVEDASRGQYISSICIVGNIITLLPKTPWAPSNFTIQYNPIQQIPSELWEIPNLEQINVYECLHLKSIGDIPHEYDSLTGFFTYGCPSLNELPDSIGNLTQLTRINMLNANLSELPDSMAKLSTIVSFKTNSPHLCQKMRETWKENTGADIPELEGYPSSAQGVIELSFDHIDTYFQARK